MARQSRAMLGRLPAPEAPFFIVVTNRQAILASLCCGFDGRSPLIARGDETIRRAWRSVAMLKLQQVLGVMRKMRSEIELSEPQFGELTDLFGISSLVIDCEGAISSINDTAADMLGFKVQELLGTMLMHLVVDGESAISHLLLQGPKTNSLEQC